MEFNDIVTALLAIAMLALVLRQHAFNKKIESKRSNNAHHEPKMKIYREGILVTRSKRSTVS